MFGSCPYFSNNALDKVYSAQLTLSWRRSLSYRNQSLGLESKLIDWFLYNEDRRHERVKKFQPWE